MEQARDEMEFAAESKETTYFDEEAAAAKEAVDGALISAFDSVCLLSFLPPIVPRGVLAARCAD